jgi:hypothetical protein
MNSSILTATRTSRKFDDVVPGFHALLDEPQIASCLHATQLSFMDVGNAIPLHAGRG